MDPFGDDDDPFGEDVSYYYHTAAIILRILSLWTNPCISHSAFQPEWAFDSQDDDNEGSTHTAKPAIYGAEHALILLDCNPAMFERYIAHEGGEHQSPMELSLTAISQLLRMRIRTVAESKTGKRNGVGVLLFGCDTYRGMRHREDSDEEGGDDKILPSTHELIELTPPGIEQVMAVQACLTKRDLEEEFSVVYRQERGEEEEDGVHLIKTALHEANKVFMNAK
jgi:hypothetical protein